MSILCTGELTVLGFFWWRGGLGEPLLPLTLLGAVGYRIVAKSVWLLCLRGAMILTTVRGEMYESLLRTDLECGE